MIPQQQRKKNQSKKIAAVDQAIASLKRLIEVQEAADGTNTAIYHNLRYRLVHLQYAREQYRTGAAEQGDAYVALASQGPPPLPEAEADGSHTDLCIRKAHAVTAALADLARVQEAARSNGTDLRFATNDERRKERVMLNFTYRAFHLRLARSNYLCGHLARGDRHVALALRGPNQ